MKKFKKISLELNKEVVSNLSNDGLNQLKGGTNQGHESNTGGLSACNDCPYSLLPENCVIVKTKDCWVQVTEGGVSACITCGPIETRDCATYPIVACMQ